MNNYEAIFNSASTEVKIKMIEELIFLGNIPNAAKGTAFNMIVFLRNQCAELSNRLELAENQSEGW